MMDYDTQLKIQAYLDGELPETEAREIANLLARDRQAVALHTELRNTRAALTGHEIGLELPESREFFWSKIQREIDRLEPAEAVAPRHSFFSGWRKILIPAGALAAIVLAVTIVGPQLGSWQSAGTAQAAVLADSSAFTYHDYEKGTTLVWLPYPAEDENQQTDEDDI